MDFISRAAISVALPAYYVKSRTSPILPTRCVPLVRTRGVRPIWTTISSPSMWRMVSLRRISLIPRRRRRRESRWASPCWRCDVVAWHEGPLHPLGMITGDFRGPAIYRRRFDKMISYDFVFERGQSWPLGTAVLRRPNGGSKSYGIHGVTASKANSGDPTKPGALAGMHAAALERAAIASEELRRSARSVRLANARTVSRTS